MEASPTYRPPDQHPAAAKMLSAQPDAVLCRLAARGNVSAYDTLYQRYHQSVFAFIFHLLGRADGTEDAEDIAQDTFTRAFAGIERKSVEGSFRAWLFTIARNRTFDLIRTRQNQVVSLDAEAARPPVAPQVDEPQVRAEQRAELVWLMGAVSALPERQRDALLMREMGGLSHESIAEQLGTTVSATKKLISRGRDGIGEAAAAGGYGRVARRRLGRDLALAAPIVPLTATLTSLGVTAGVGGAAAGSAAIGGVAVSGGAIAGGKIAATALTVIAIGGGAVAVEHRGVPTPERQPSSANSASGPNSIGAARDDKRGRPRGNRPDDAGLTRGPGDRAEAEVHGGRGGEFISDANGARSSSGRSGEDRKGSGDGGHRGRGGSEGGSGSYGEPLNAPNGSEPAEDRDSGSDGSNSVPPPESGSSNSGPGSDGGAEITER